MKNPRMSLAHRLWLALFLIASLAPGVAQAQSPAPFKATIAIVETIETVGSPPCLLLGNISGTGVASHGGKVTVASTDCINPMNATSFSFASERVVLSVASGEQIWARYAGTLAVEGPIGVIAGGYEVIGGTGRFTRAKGAGTIQGIEDMTTGKGQIQLVGTIAY